MAITEVQTTQNHNNGASSLTFNLSTNITAGNCVVVGACAYNDTSSQAVTGVTVESVTATTGTTIDLGFATFPMIGIWYLANAPGGSTGITVTANTSTSMQINAFAWEFSGLSTTSPADQFSGDSALSNSWTSNTTATLTDASEVAVGFMTGAQTATFTLGSPSSPWVNGTTITNSLSSKYTRSLGGYNIVSSTTGLAYAASASQPVDWCAVILTLMPPAVSAPVGQTQVVGQAIRRASLW